jgi:hypothetical protein
VKVIASLVLMALSIPVAMAALGALYGGSAPPFPGEGRLRLPAGWREIARPITGVLYPTQVLAAATYPVSFQHEPGSCSPRAALGQMPAQGVLLQVVDYKATDSGGRSLRVPRLLPRPRRFSYADAIYARFECAGPSYKFDYMEGGQALQAQVWMHRRRVDPRERADALEILNHFRPQVDAGARSGRSAMRAEVAIGEDARPRG